MAYVLGHSGARFVVCGDQEQVDKVIEAEGEAHTVEQIITPTSAECGNTTIPA